MNSQSLIKFTRSSALATLCALSMTSSARAQFTYTYYPTDTAINSDVTTDFAIVGFSGGSYNDDFTLNFTGASSPIVEVASRANVTGEIDSFNHSVVNMTGGSVVFFFPVGNSILNIKGGNIDSVLNEDAGVVNVTGGTVSDLEGQGKTINVSGGTIGTLVANVNTSRLGATLGSCIVNVAGGEVTGEVDSYNEGILNLRGGNLDGDLYARFGGTINLYGSNLIAPLIDAGNRGKFSLYSLSGVLEDGTVLKNKNLFIENDGVTYGHSSFTLINAVPEPGAIALLLGVGVSGVGLLMRRRRK